MKKLNITPTYGIDKALKSIELTGHLITMDAINFKTELLNLISNQTTALEINLEGLSALDVTGLNALAMAHKKMKQKGLTLTILNKPESPANEFLHLTKFSKYFNLEVA